ncbi:hypothetical protein PROFUN_13859 [Planoprotostelium fungivorum]|uniref:Retrotransposon gag domain-containing protein n=1 Tax=Planoprotostelium fungivorum TaxID=1890364 RepID=A0A2P6N2R0_9EUKA|nr:hypothetical protein PROFUN_13859 [Planoprotostelium fungivorum]
MSDHISRPEYNQELFNLQAELVEALDARILKIQVSRKDENAKAQRQELLDERQDLLENIELVIQLRDSAHVASASALNITPPSNRQVKPKLKPESVESATAKDSTCIPSNLPSFMDSMGKGRPVYQDPIQFTRMFESTVKANGLPADHHWERLFEISVNNDRYLWAQANAFNRNLTWKDFTKLFHDHYNQPGLKRRIKAQLFKMTMHDGETVLQFGDRFKGLMVTAGIADGEDYADLFIECLPSYIKSTIHSAIHQRTNADPNSSYLRTVAEVMDFATVQERDYKNIRTPTKVSTQPSKDKPSYREPCPLPNHTHLKSESIGHSGKANI